MQQRFLPVVSTSACGSAWRVSFYYAAFSVSSELLEVALMVRRREPGAIHPNVALDKAAAGGWIWRLIPLS